MVTRLRDLEIGWMFIFEEIGSQVKRLNGIHEFYVCGKRIDPKTGVVVEICASTSTNPPVWSFVGSALDLKVVAYATRPKTIRRNKWPLN